jgi:DNA-binding NtrC family response regulator
VRVLIAEDEPDICLTYKIALESRNHEAVIAQNGDECMDIYKKEFFTINDSQYRLVDRNDGYMEGLINNKNTVILSNDTSNGTSNSGTGNSSISRSSSFSPFDAVVLDYRMPGKDGLQVAKEIFEINPEQRIIFASAYVKETLESSIKELKRVVELMQKPFDADVLVGTIEDREAQEGLKILMRNLTADGNSTKDNDGFEPSLQQLTDLFEGLRKIQKGRTF